MAKYAQGFGRKNSDTKNLIILFSSIFAVVVITILLVLLGNKLNWFKTATARTFSDDAYTDYFVDSTKYSRLDDLVEGEYVIYVCDTSSTDEDSDTEAIMNYIEKYEKDNTLVQIFLLDVSEITVSSSDSDTTNQTNLDNCKSGRFATISSWETPLLIHVPDEANRDSFDRSLDVTAKSVSEKIEKLSNKESFR